MTKPKLIIFIVSALIIIATLFIPPFYGKGDDGSFFAILTENGLYNSEGADTSFFNSVFGVSPASEGSGFLPITIAKVLCGFVSTTILDIRVLALLYVPFYLAGMYLIMKWIHIKNNVLEAVVCAVAAIILCDIGYISYMNSFYKEALYLVFFLLFVGSALNIKKDEGVYMPCALALILSAAVLAFMGAGGMILGVVAGIALILGGVVFKNISPYSAVCGVLAAAISVGCFFAAPAQSETAPQLYSRVFEGALYETASPEEELKAFGIDEKYASFAGKNYYEASAADSAAVSALSPACLEELSEKATRVDVFMFYLKNPGRFISVLSAAGRNAPFLTQSYISTKMNTDYFIKAAPGIWSYARRFMTPANFWILLGIAILVLAASFILYKKDIGIMLSGIIVSVSSIVFLVCPILQSGLLSISRNLILHQAAVDLMIILILCCAINIALDKRQALKDKYGVNQ